MVLTRFTFEEYGSKDEKKYMISIDNINLMFFVTVVLDPRYRSKYVEF